MRKRTSRCLLLVGAVAGLYGLAPAVVVRAQPANAPAKPAGSAAGAAATPAAAPSAAAAGAATTSKPGAAAASPAAGSSAAASTAAAPPGSAAPAAALETAGSAAAPGGAAPSGGTGARSTAPAAANMSLSPWGQEAQKILGGPPEKVPSCPTGVSAQAASNRAAKRSFPPPPAPTAADLARLEQKRAEVTRLEGQVKLYREAISDIIKRHYASKKQELLSGLEDEIRTEKLALKDAQAKAVQSLERFIAEYSGSRADPEATPDAMFRLAALYEERARSEDTKDDLSVALMPAMDLYRRIIVDFPKYRDRAAIFYFLGHALNDAGRIDEAQQVWRSLVCNNVYPYPTGPDPKKAGHDLLRPMLGDNTEAYWIEWRKRYPTPESLRKGGPDTRFTDPFPATCTPVAQSVGPGEEPRYLAEIWWQIGNWEFDQLDPGAGLIRNPREPDLMALPSVYGYNRAASAYAHSLQFKRPQIYGVALYKYAWTLFKQQRYEAAVREFVKLLQFTDEQEKITGDPGADFRAEAYTYIAGSLTNVDFTGPAADEPFIPRPDIVEEADTAVAERKLRVAIERVQDPKLIPQDRPWTIEIYKGLASEFRSLNQFNNALEVYEAILKRWPLDPTAPETQAAVAETYDQLNIVNNRPGTAEYDRIAEKSLAARTGLAAYVGNTPWVEANKANTAAIQKAERLAKSGLRSAAAAHTNGGRQALVEAQQSGDIKYQTDRLTRSMAEYKLAAVAWQGYLHQDENAPDAYESRYWLADAWHNEVRIAVVLHQLDGTKFPEPTPQEIQEATKAAIAVRDSNEDDKYLDNAALFVVDLADVARDLAYQRYAQSGGKEGVEERTKLRMEGEGTERPTVLCDVIPPVVMDSILAREEYIERVPPSMDVNKNAIEYQYYNAEKYFLYGQFTEASRRFESMWREHCAKDKFGYMAWEKLITMSNLMNDSERSRKLAEEEKAHACAVSQEQLAGRDLIINPTLQEAAYLKARERFKQAQNAPEGPEKERLWREAAGLYEAALSAAPARDEAPEAAMNAAYAYKQVGEFNRAIELYQKFINEYGNEERLTALQKGDPKTKKGPDPKRYEERVKYLSDAYDALSSSYYGFFNYVRAAETFEKISTVERFDAKKRKDAARNALILYANMRMKDRMMGAYTVFNKLGPTPEEKANADYIVADYEFKQWNPQGGDGGANRATRLAASGALTGFYQKNFNNPAAAKYTLEASWKLARMAKSAQDPQYRQWYRTTTKQWQFLDQQSKGKEKESQSAPFVDYGAEAEFVLLDEQMREKFDYETNHHRYAGSVEDIVGEYDASGKLKKQGAYQQSAKDAKQYMEQLEKIYQTYRSPDYAVAIRSRQGSLFDSLRTALYETRPPALKYFTPKQENLLKQLENSGRDELMEKADQYRDQKKEFWRTQRDREINAADEVAIDRYVRAVLYARQLNVRNPEVARALSRLAYLTDVLGDAKMREFVSKVPDPSDPSGKKMVEYRDGMFMQARPGLDAPPPPSARGPISPAAP